MKKRKMERETETGMVEVNRDEQRWKSERIGSFECAFLCDSIACKNCCEKVTLEITFYFQFHTVNCLLLHTVL